MIHDGLISSICIIVLIACCGLFYTVGQAMVATDCETLGKFRHNDTAYECHKQESK